MQPIKTKLWERLPKQAGREEEHSRVRILIDFQYLDTGISRAEFPARLTKLMGLKYDKSDENIYSQLHEHQPTAIRNAKNLLKALQARGDIPERNFNPSTNVHQLVEFLNALCELEPVE